jgi:nucleoside 2-deoxyribosyltransferase
MTIYLCGSITADPVTHRWRRVAESIAANLDMTTLSPMRGKDPDRISKDGLTSDIPAMLFTTRDLRDIHNSDVLLLYALGIESLDRQSIGTWAEFGIAIERGMPIVVVATAPSVTQHPFVVKWASAVVPTLQEAMQTINWLH